MGKGNQLALRRSASALLAALLGGAPVALAQSAPAKVPEKASVPIHGVSGRSTDAIEQVVVTATRRSESIQKVALSISALTGSQLQHRGIVNYEDLVRMVPGINATGTTNFDTFTIRGISTSDTTANPGQQKTVAVYLNDLPLTSFNVATPDIFPYDIKRVEVLRGPQGTLFGSGSLGGAIRYITNMPDPTGYHASALVDFGYTKGGAYQRRLAGMINLPIISDKLALRVVGYTVNDGGWVTNLQTVNNRNPSTPVRNANTENDWGVRASLCWQPNERTDVTFMFTDDTNHMGDLASYNPALGLNKRQSDFRATPTLSVKSYNATLKYNFGWAHLVSSTTYADAYSRSALDIDTVLPGIFPYYFQEVIDTKSVVEDTRLMSQARGRFSWLAGGYYLYQVRHFAGTDFTSSSFLKSLNIVGLPTNIAPGPAFTNDVETKRNFEAALYGDATYKFTKTIHVTAGMRVSQTDFNVIANSKADFSSLSPLLGAVFSGGNATIPLIAPAPYQAGTGYKISVTPKFDIQWQPDTQKNFYILVSRGFRRGQPNGYAFHANNGKSLVNPNDPAIIPEAATSDSLWNYELGAKTMWFGGRLQADAALYYIDWSNMQVALVRSSDSVPFVGNIGAARSIGFEGELETRPLENLQVGLSVTLNNSEVTSLTAEQALISGAVKGASLASPDVKIGSTAQYDWDIGKLGALYARADVQYVGSYPNGFPNTPGTAIRSTTYAVVPSYENVNLAVGWLKNNFTVSLYAQNVMDNQTPIFIDAASYSVDRYVTLRPRTIGIRLTWSD